MKQSWIKRTSAMGASLLLTVALIGCGGKGSGLNPQIDGIKGPDVEMIDGRFLLSMTFENLHLDQGVTIPIPKYPNSSLALGPDFESDGTLLVFTVAVEDFINIGDRGLDPQTLPGGRPLPGVSNGALPSLALKAPEVFDSVFYVGPKVLGLFVPIRKLDLDGAILSFRFYDKDGVQVGNLSLVSQDEQKKNGGLLVLINIDRRIENSMNNYMASI